MLNVLLVECEPASVSLEKMPDLDVIDLLAVQYSPLFLSFVKESKPDLVILNSDKPCDKLFADLRMLGQQFPLPIIMFSNDGSNEIIDKAIKSEVSAFVVNGFPLTSQRLNSLIQVALSRFKQTQVLKNDLEEARTQLEDRKQIDRAKAILIRTQNFTEDKAYHTLRKLAMDRNITLGEMSRNVIAMAELLK
ncbi:response regulator [Methyloglobulus morosus KoM1]|uniref:Response regulator n=1 Tax=Methyloglobulus morosus KoM1 TaxID=1116472 RepID=V5C593_9GAMM|nr:ANTAR domain-containing protein [Methyloglobulus morosus]ESS71898.1 response regulator [Methyloglobulus morosus KoM1]